MFKWELPVRPKISKEGKFVYKIPMKMIFIDEANRGFEFKIKEGKPTLTYLFSCTTY